MPFASQPDCERPDAERRNIGRNGRMKNHGSPPSWARVGDAGGSSRHFTEDRACGSHRGCGPVSTRPPASRIHACRLFDVTEKSLQKGAGSIHARKVRQPRPGPPVSCPQPDVRLCRIRPYERSPRSGAHGQRFTSDGGATDHVRRGTTHRRHNPPCGPYAAARWVPAGDAGLARQWKGLTIELNAYPTKADWRHYDCFECAYPYETH